MSGSSKLELQSIRDALIRQEDTIIFALIERAQFAQNAACYDSDNPAYSHLSSGGLATSADSFLDFMLLETERLHARVRRYTSPDEHAFFPQRLPPPELPLLDFASDLHPAVVNLNDRIKQLYLNKVLPAMCPPGDDQQHGSSVVADVAVLQAISKRVHYGMFVAESKFRSQVEEYTRLIRAPDEEGIMALLTNAAVEARVLQRVRKKASTFGREIDEETSLGTDHPLLVTADGAAAADAVTLRERQLSNRPLRLDPEVIVTLYHDYVIPLTKVAEVQYLLQRLDDAVVAFHGVAGGLTERTVANHFVPTGQPHGMAPSLLRVGEGAEVIAAVMSHKAHHGVLVIEQGDSGVQAGALALLRACPDDLQVVGEIRGASRFRLASPVPLLSVNKLRGRREALRLCSGWLRRQLTHVVDFEEVETTDDQPEWGATLGRPEHGRTAYVTSLEATLDPRLHVTREVGDDDASERLRCVVLSHKTDDAPPAGPEKTLALFGLRDGAGTLAQALDVFNRHAVNLTYIQSHADLAAPGQFNFYCELQGHRRAEATQAALAELRGCSVFLKVLGSYGARHVTVM